MSQSAVLKGVVWVAMLLSLSCSAMQQAILRDDTGYKVLDNGRWNQVKSYDVDPALRKMNKEQLCKFFAAGCKIRATKTNNGDYILRSFVPGKGGGLVLAYAFYWATKAAAYGALTGAAVTAVAATGGAAAAGAVGAVGAVATAGAGAATTVAAGAVASGVGSAVGVSVAATAATTAVAGAGAAAGLAAVTTAIEAASLAAGALGAWIPFL